MIERDEDAYLDREDELDELGGLLKRATPFRDARTIIVIGVGAGVNGAMLKYLGEIRGKVHLPIVEHRTVGDRAVRAFEEATAAFEALGESFEAHMGRLPDRRLNALDFQHLDFQHLEDRLIRVKPMLKPNDMTRGQKAWNRKMRGW